MLPNRGSLAFLEKYVVHMCVGQDSVGNAPCSYYRTYLGYIHIIQEMEKEKTQVLSMRRQ